MSFAAWLIAAVWTWHHHAASVSLWHGASVSFWIGFTGICVAFACLALPLGKRRLEVGHPSLATVYALPATALLFTVGFIPAIRLFNASVLFQNVVAARRSQLEVAYRFQQRRERINSEFSGASFLLQRLDNEARDLYYLDSTSGGATTDLQPQNLEPLLSSIASKVLVHVHDGSSPKHWLGLYRPDAARVWCEQDGPFPEANLILRIAGTEKGCTDPKGKLTGYDHNSWIVSKLPQRAPLQNPGADLTVFVESVPIVGMLVAAFFGLRYAIRRLFALDWERPQAWLDVEISPALDLRDPRFGRRAIFLGEPRSGKTEALTHHSGVRYIDLTGYSQSRIEDPPLGSDDVVVLDHFEHDLDNSLQRGRKLSVLERLVFELKCRIVIVTTIDPMYYFDTLAKRSSGSGSERDDNLDIERWTNVLAAFQVVRTKNRSSLEGERYFALLWQTCSVEERAALHQIAVHGWANCRQALALTHLFQRGLVVHDRKFELADPDFTKYIEGSFRDEHFVIPEKSGTADALSAIRIVLVVAGIAFIAALAYVWGDQMVAYVATGASAVTAATRAFAKSKGRGPMGSTEV